MAVDTTLAQTSNTLIYSAMLVYTGALGAFVTDLARREVTVLDAERTRQAVPVGAGTTAGPDDAATDHATTDDATTDDAITDAAGSDAAGSEPASRHGRTKAGGIAVSLTWLALILHVAGVAARGISAQRVPWGNMYEFSVAGAMVVTAVFVVVLLRRDVRYLGTFVIGPVLLTLGLAVTVFYTQSAQLVPALHSFWLVIHVSIAFIASALYTLAFSTTVLQLVQERREQARSAGKPPKRGRFMDALPTAAALERSSYSLHVAAFPLWTFTLLAGAIWAESAWGRYWNWDPKEVWTFVIWVVYAGHLHARATRGWDGRRAALFALAGYACILMNFMVVNVFFVGKHSYGGL